VSDDSSLDNSRTVIVTTDDGTLFSCEPFAVGGPTVPQSLRWRLIDARGVMYIGPTYDREASLADVQRLVSAWWEKTKVWGP